MTTACDHPIDTITLDETGRHRRRIQLTTDNGLAFTLDLPKAQRLRHGDGLVLESGEVIKVLAEPEDLMEVTGRDAQHLVQLAWQIGNRHLAAEITSQSIRIRRDHVVQAMLEGLGASVRPVRAAFDPEGGAYGDAHHSHHHDHSHG
ncbi:MAG: urease accessory protein UreE [Pseudomonadota bacterium]